LASLPDEFVESHIFASEARLSIPWRVHGLEKLEVPFVTSTFLESPQG